MNNLLLLTTLHEENPKQLALEAYNARLYVRSKHWSLTGMLKRLKETGLGKGEAILLAKISNMPVGVSTLSDGHIEVYVKQAYRGCGIGSLLVNKIRQKHNGMVWGSEGMIGTKKFWEYNKIGVH